MLEKTTNLQLPLLVQNQAGKEITHNEALIILDNIVQNGIIDKDLTIPPTEPNTNDLYIVGKNATGLWEDKDNQLAFYDNGWHFIEPRKGFIFWINDENKLYCFNGTKWQEITSSSSGSTTPTEITELQNLSLLGVNATADEDNKLSVKSDYVLFDNITNNSRIKVNKATINDIASHLFQTNYSGRAEFGLIGNDNFTLKVSNDGENWNSAFVVDKATGNIDFKGTITNNGKSIGENSSQITTIVSNGESSFVSPLEFVSTSAFKSLATNIKFDEDTDVSFSEITKTLTNFTEGNSNGSLIDQGYIYDWKQPIIASDSENGITLTASHQDTLYPAWKVMDGIKTGTEQNCFFAKSTPGWLKIELGYQILISEIKVYNNFSASSHRMKTFQIWKDETKTEALSDIITATNSNYSLSTIILETPVLTNSLYIEILSSYATWAGIIEIELTAKTNDITKSTYSGWLDVYAITNNNGTKQDICCVKNNSNFILPTNFTKKRLCGWLYLNNNLEIEKFYIKDNNYYLANQTLDAGNITITTTKTDLRIKTPITNSNITANINVNYGSVNPNLYITSSDFDDRTPTQALDRQPYGGFSNYSVPVGNNGKIKLIASTNLTATNISTVSFNYKL